MKTSFGLFAIVFLALFTAVPVFSDVTIAPDGSGDFPTIQAGILAIAAGETVWLTDGTFTGTGNIELDFGGKDLTVRSISDDPSLCLIDCELIGHGFYLHTDETIASEIRGITVLHWYGGDGGVLLYHGAMTVTNCIISECLSDYGGASVYCAYGSLVMSDCTVSDNTSYNDSDEVLGGGIYLNGGGQSSISSSAILRNICYSEDGGAGGGIYNEDQFISLLV